MSTSFDFGIKIEETKWAINPIIPLGHLAIFLAQAGTGKSLILESIAVHSVYEIPFCGFDMIYGDVLIVDQDTPTNTLSGRLVKFGKALGIKPKYELFVESMQNYSLGNGTLCTLIKDHPTVHLVIIDSLHSVCGKLNPNYTTDMGYSLSKLKSECLSPDITILVNHHISEKTPYTIEQLMTDNTHQMAMGSSAIIQQADSYYIVGAVANNGLTNRLYVRPVAKRASIRSTPLILQVVQPDHDSEKLEFEADYVLDLNETELDCLTLFKEFPGVRTVKDVYNDMGQKHGIVAVRKALKSLHQKNAILMSRHRSDLFKYKLP